MSPSYKGINDSGNFFYYNVDMILFVIVGSIFALIGAALLYMRYYFIKHATKTWGKVIALEKNVTRRRSGSHSSTVVTYSPLVEYVFKGETYWFSAGGSSNNLYKFKIDQRVALLSLDKGPEYVMLENGVTGVLGKIFFVLGFLTATFGLWQMLQRPPVTWTDWLWDYGVLFFLFPPAFATFSKVKKAYDKADIKISEQMLKAAKLETDESLKGRKLYWSRSQLKKEVGNVNQVAFVISSIFFVGSIVGLFFAWQWLPLSTQSLISQLPPQTESLSVLINLLKKKNPQLVLFLVMLFFSLLGTHSFIYSIRKKNS